MMLTQCEQSFLRHWMYDEAHNQAGMGPAKRLQIHHRAASLDLVILIAAGIPNLADQEQAGIGPPPPEPAVWPWSEDELRARLAEARAVLATKTKP